MHRGRVERRNPRLMPVATVKEMHGKGCGREEIISTFYGMKGYDEGDEMPG